METLAYAADAAQGAQGASGISSMLFPLVLMFAVFYFLLIRPQQKKQKQHDQMLKSLNKGDKVITSGGLYGIVSKVTDKDVVLEVADKVNLRFTLGAIGTIRESEGTKEAKEAD